MTKKILIITTLIFAIKINAVSAETLFNGKDLSGWDGNPDFWSVENGVIVGETTPDKKTSSNTFLIWKGGEVGDFELTLKARVKGNNNSGIQYRSKVINAKSWSVGGYQMDMHPAPNYLGMLYEERGRGIIAQCGQRAIIDDKGKKALEGKPDAKKKYNLSDWNEYSISAIGNRLVHKVNGQITVEIEDNEISKKSSKGILALQLHAGGAMRLEVKDIVLVNKKNESAKVKESLKNHNIFLINSAQQASVPTVKWIWNSKSARTETIYARRQWTLSTPLKSSKLSITCDNGFTAFVNGQKVGSGSQWETHYEFDIKKYLHNGDNVLAVEAHNEGQAAGLAAKVKLVAANGVTRHIVSDNEWIVANKKAPGWMAPSVDTTGWKNAVVAGKMGDTPWGDVFSKKPGLPVAVAAKGAAEVHPKGFEVEKIYNVPKGEQGSWVSMAVDSKGRLYCGDQGGKGIFRVTLSSEEPKIEKVPVPVSGAQGLLWAFDSLYVCTNGGKPGSGLYRLTDSNGDDVLDKVQDIRRFSGGGEHGPHAVSLSPDGKYLYVVGGNHTAVPKPESSALKMNYAEDQLLPRMPDARGHARNIRAPGGWIARTDPEGKAFHLYSAGFRNHYDIAFNRDGEMFTYDSDMEWDSGTPWYRPTRIYHVTSGSEFGWRTGTGKFPEWYPDVLPPTLDIGPGCPTGVISGLGSKFPAKYQDAIYAFDWTYGTIYAIHLDPDGSSYKAKKEEFVTGVPLNVTDGVIGKDGNMYFAVGGRGTQSALYRVKYSGSESTAAIKIRNNSETKMIETRRALEDFHGKEVQGAIEKIWPKLSHADRFVRYAARVALEHQPVVEWQEKALEEEDPQTLLSALLALSRQGDAALKEDILNALSTLNVSEMTESQKLEALRVMGLTFIRMGGPDEETAQEIAEAISPLYPASSDAMNRELVAMLVYLKADDVLAKTIPLMNQEAAGLEEIEFDDKLLARSGQYGGSFQRQKASNPQRQQIWYAYALKNVEEGWNENLRKQFFSWFAKSRNFKGGASFGGFINNFRNESLNKIKDAKVKAEMDSLTKKPIALIPEGFEDARILKVGAKPGMKFDIESLEAKAGEKIGIEFINNDPTGLMHNLAVCAPGSRQKVVASALTIGPKAIEQNFVPDIPEVLASTPQVAPGRKYVLYMSAPSTPGSYPYVCTYPGHGQLMFGTLKVTK